MGVGVGRAALLTLSSSSAFTLSLPLHRRPFLPKLAIFFLQWPSSSSSTDTTTSSNSKRRTLFTSTATSTTTTAIDEASPEADKLFHSERRNLLLEKLRTRHLKQHNKDKDNAAAAAAKPATQQPAHLQKKKKKMMMSGGDNAESDCSFSSFMELGLNEEVMGAVNELGISVPTEIQGIGIPAILEGKSVVLGSHTGSGKTLAYLLPLVQLLKQDEAESGMILKPRRPRAVILCPTRELSEQVFRVSKSISHHAKFRSTMISGGGRAKPQEDSLNVPIDMIVGTPGRVLQHLEEGNMVYGDIKYVVLDEADTMFDHGFGPDIRKFLGPLKNRASKPDDPGFRTVLVSATMTKAVQKLIDDEFQGISHLRTSSFQKKIASARHDFLKITGAENKLETLLQVLEPSLAKGNRVMVFCNTLNSSRAVDHFLSENQFYTVNYHGEVPAEERVENLNKFKSNDGDCPTLVCTDLAARGLDLDVDHVIMFDFPLNSIDYLHRTGRTARMGAKGKVTSIVTKRDFVLATKIEDALRKNESLELLSFASIKRDVAVQRIRKSSTKVGMARTKGSPKYGGSRSEVVQTKGSPKHGRSRSEVVQTKGSLKHGRSRSEVVQTKGNPKHGKSRPAVSTSSRGETKRKTPDKKKVIKTNTKETVSGARKVSFGIKKEGLKSKKVGLKKSGSAPSKIKIAGFRGRNSSAKNQTGM